MGGVGVRVGVGRLGEGEIGRGFKCEESKPHLQGGGSGSQPTELLVSVEYSYFIKDSFFCRRLKD